MICLLHSPFFHLNILLHLPFESLLPVTCPRCFIFCLQYLQLRLIFLVYYSYAVFIFLYTTFAFYIALSFIWFLYSFMCYLDFWSLSFHLESPLTVLHIYIPKKNNWMKRKSAMEPKERGRKDDLVASSAPCTWIQTKILLMYRTVIYMLHYMRAQEKGKMCAMKERNERMTRKWLCTDLDLWYSEDCVISRCACTGGHSSTSLLPLPPPWRSLRVRKASDCRKGSRGCERDSMF